MLPIKTTLLLNGVSSLATGAGLIVFATKVAELFGVTDKAPFIEAGVFLIVFASLVVFTAIKNPQNNGLVRLITVLDIFWVIGSVILIVITKPYLSTIGIVAILAVAVWVSLMALLQTKGIKKTHTDATVISL
ncbi:MAG: hypothetical protein WKI04_16525 [Ferruginibacter sp.]